MSRHKWAERAQRNDAFGLVMLNRLDDLKSDAVRESLSLGWYEFTISDKDRADLKVEYECLTSIANDPSAGFLRYHITEYIEAYGKLPPIVAEWPLERIPIAPHCYLVKGFDGSDVIVHHRGYDALPSFDQDKESEHSRRCWSSDFGDSSGDRIPALKWPGVGGIVADPRAYHSSV